MLVVVRLAMSACAKATGLQGCLEEQLCCGLLFLRTGVWDNVRRVSKVLKNDWQITWDNVQAWVQAQVEFTDELEKE